MIRRRSLRTRGIKMLILDEADEMLNQGFKEQIYDVYRYLPPGTQVVLLSATLPREILEMTTKFMTDPIRVRQLRHHFGSLSREFLSAIRTRARGVKLEFTCAADWMLIGDCNPML